MRELPLAWSYLKGRPIRTVMTILSIMIGVMMMFGLNGLAPAFQEMFVSSTQSVALSSVDLYVTRQDGSFFRQEYEQNVAAVPGVESTASMISRIRALLIARRERLRACFSSPGFSTACGWFWTS